MHSGSAKGSRREVGGRKDSGSQVRPRKVLTREISVGKVGANRKVDTTEIVGVVTARRVKLRRREAGGSGEIYSPHGSSAQGDRRKVGRSQFGGCKIDGRQNGGTQGGAC